MSATACDCLRLPATAYDCRCLTADACCLLLPDAINCGLLLLLSRLLIYRRLSRICSTRTENLSSSWAQNWVLKTPLKVPPSDMAYTVLPASGDSWDSWARTVAWAVKDPGTTSYV